MARRLKVNGRESVRKSGRADLSPEELARRDKEDKITLSRWAYNCRREGPALFRRWNGVWELPDKPLEIKKPTSSK